MPHCPGDLLKTIPSAVLSKIPLIKSLSPERSAQPVFYSEMLFCHVCKCPSTGIWFSDASYKHGLFSWRCNFFEESDVCFLLRDYIKGPLLGEHSEHLYARYTHFRDFENALLPYMMECCQIISILHHEKPPIIHRDIKPETLSGKNLPRHLCSLTLMPAGNLPLPKQEILFLPEHMVMLLQSNSVSDKAISVPMYMG